MIEMNDPAGLKKARSERERAGVPQGKRSATGPEGRFLEAFCELGTAARPRTGSGATHDNSAVCNFYTATATTMRNTA